MSPYWLNNSCSPFAPFAGANGSGSCTLGNLAQYAINISDAATVAAGIKFAQDKNIRLTIKNTGHDVLGRSAGEGSLALWTHYLKDISFLNYTSANYTGPAARVGAGVEVLDLYQAAATQNLRVVGGSCPTVGVAGGWTPGGGHGPLTSTYGLGADATLEFEVVTADGRHLTATPTNENADLYWALSGGGGGNYAVVLSIVVKAHADGPVAGANFTFLNTNPDNFWTAVLAWLKHLPVLDNIPGFKTVGTFTNDFFALDFATLPDATTADLSTALAPFLQQLQALNISFIQNVTTTVHPSFVEHYQYFTTDRYTTNISVANRLISRSFANTPGSLDKLVAEMRDMAANAGVFNVIANNVTHARVGNYPESNSVLPAWRDSLFDISFGLSLDANADWDQIRSHQATINVWQTQFRDLTPGGGAYINEATFDDVNWKDDYYGINYDRLNAIKQEYDPTHTFWAVTAVGSDDYWSPAEDGRLCRVS